ncbi:7335_t:CDS:2 [Dentiscutata erythropus]|uniref:7335_t:CDS:1 n=1 Tax=Dentiscutata erythropus TaxID=1348616 RepID=A0A9N9F213_9GLOM|nr:7335_t:CDS:2 [Dentiscutata erythropus]
MRYDMSDAQRNLPNVGIDHKLLLLVTNQWESARNGYRRKKCRMLVKSYTQETN